MVGAYPERVKEFWVYTGLRMATFVASFALVVGLWLPLLGRANLVFAFVISLVLSGIASYFLLRGPREAFARRVEERAAQASARFEEMRAKEDLEDELRDHRDDGLADDDSRRS